MVFFHIKNLNFILSNHNFHIQRLIYALCSSFLFQLKIVLFDFFANFIKFIRQILMQKSLKEHSNLYVPKIIAVGKNYLQHVQEMGGQNVPQNPVIFLKPWSSIVFEPKTLWLPLSQQHNIEHQLELGVFIGKGGKDIPKQSANNHIGGYFLALDISDRTFQKDSKIKSYPWLLSKGQDNFCPITDLFQQKVDPYSVQLHMKVNEKTRQKDMTSKMHFKIDEIISFTSKYVTLSEGDLILTGTPSGVGPLKPGDRVLATAKFQDKIVGKFQFDVTK